MKGERKTKKGQPENNLEENIEKSMKDYMLRDVIVLNKEKQKLTLKNTFNGRRNPVFIGNS